MSLETVSATGFKKMRTSPLPDPDLRIFWISNFDQGEFLVIPDVNLEDLPSSPDPGQIMF